MQGKRSRNGTNTLALLCAALLLIAVGGWVGYGLHAAKVRSGGSSGPRPAIATVDLAAIEARTSAGRAFRTLLQDHKKVLEDTIAQERAAMSREDRELTARKGNLPAAEFDTKVQDLRRRVVEHNARVARSQETLTLSIRATLSQLQTAADEVVRELAAERSAVIVIAGQAIAYADPGLDITEPVIARVDKRLPTLSWKQVDSKQTTK